MGADHCAEESPLGCSVLQGTEMCVFLFLGWAVASLLDVILVAHFGSKFGISLEDSAISAGISFLFTMLMHWEIEKHTQQCHPDEYLRPVVQANIDIFAAV